MVKSPFSLICIIAAVVSVFAFWAIILTHLGNPGMGTSLWGVPTGSKAPRLFCAVWLPTWAVGIILACFATRYREPLRGVAVATVALQFFPILYEIWGLLTGPY